MTIKASIIKLRWFFDAQLGINPGRFLKALIGFPRYVADWLKFRRGYTGRLRLMPCLNEQDEEGGAAGGEYFWQDLLVARWIFAANPTRHVDVGSRVDGFVAHVASYREIEVFDVRPVNTRVPGIVFKQADLMDPESIVDYWREGEGYCDSLSCLHAIEHFGLGRYGDAINVDGYQSGIANLTKLLKPAGTFYLATPIGQERVEFNAHRVFDPRTIISCAEANGLALEKMTIFGSDTGLQEIVPSAEMLTRLAESEYNLGIFIFRKPERNHSKAC